MFDAPKERPIPPDQEARLKALATASTQEGARAFECKPAPTARTGQLHAHRGNFRPGVYKYTIRVLLALNGKPLQAGTIPTIFEHGVIRP